MFDWLIILLFIFSIGLIFYGYYRDYIADPKEFVFSLKSLGKGILVIAIYVAVTFLYDIVFPINKNHGIDYNSQRIELGIPILEKDWKISTGGTSQFVTEWMKPANGSKGHFKKIITYGLWDVKTEEDYYQSTLIEGGYVWKIYSYKTQGFTYFGNFLIVKPSVFSENGKVKFKSVKDEKISEEEFFRNIK